MIDPRLIRAINGGRCFVLIGSGPSCEMGYTSWSRLASDVVSEINRRNLSYDQPSYAKNIAERKYPELFRSAERDLGDRQQLIQVVKGCLAPTIKNRGSVYEIITRWPFACYLTTNYDDEIEIHLHRINEHFTRVLNRTEDFYAFRDGVNHIIQKLHGDLEHPNDVILTSRDYSRLYVEDSGQYFRTKLRQIFEMFDILIVGHSLYDPDIKYVLQQAKTTASPQHPIFLVAADFTKEDELEYLEKYNIVVVGYENLDGTHSKLHRLLKTVDRFVVPRGQKTISVDSRPVAEIESATALFLYRRLRSERTAENMEPLVLSGLYAKDSDGVEITQLASLPNLTNFAKNNTDFAEALRTAAEALIERKLATRIAERIAISESGRAVVSEFQRIREIEKEQAFGQFVIDLKRIVGEEIGNAVVNHCRQLAERVIVASFANRGLAIANRVFAGQSASAEDLTDMFHFISASAANLADLDVRGPFVEAMYQFLVEPNGPQRNYLASVSQGYFMYNLFGLDPKFSRAQRDIFGRTLWICDSSVLLPLVAVGCYNNEYAVRLFVLLSEAKANIITTPNLLNEAWDHLVWAAEFIRKNGSDSAEFLRAALVKGSYKQNLFIDGYIRLSADGEVGSFGDYLSRVLPSGINRESFNEQITRAGVIVQSLPNTTGFEESHWADYEDAKVSLRDEREKKGTYRSELQIESEAEVWVLLSKLRSGEYLLPGSAGNIDEAYFVSESRLFESTFRSVQLTTWTPEALFRYITAMPGQQTDPDLLQQCLLHEYFYAGVSFIDRNRYLRYFGPSIDAAKAAFKEERAAYIRVLEDRYTRGISEAFGKTPDLEKPFFVSQMITRTSAESERRERLAQERASAAEARIKELELEKSEAWKGREARRQQQEASRLRNLSDPKHVRKREKQAKKRSRKKSK